MARICLYLFCLLLSILSHYGITLGQGAVKNDKFNIKQDSLMTAVSKEIKGINLNDSSQFFRLHKMVDKYFYSVPAIVDSVIDIGIEASKKIKCNSHLFVFTVSKMQLSNVLGLFDSTILLAQAMPTSIMKGSHPKHESAFYVALANAYVRKALWNKASDYYNKAITISRKAGLVEVQVRTMTNLACMYEYVGDFSQMESGLKLALEIAEQNNLKKDIAIIYYNLSYLASKSNDYGQAIKLMFPAIEYFKNASDSFSLSGAYSNLAWYYYQVKELSKSLDLARAAYKLKAEFGDNFGIARSYHTISRVYYDMGKYDSALVYADKLILLARSLSLIEDLKNAYETKMMAFERIKKWEFALESSKEYILWSDSFNKVNRIKELNSQLLEFKYFFSDSLVSESKRNSSKIRREVNLYRGGVIGLIMFIMLTFFIINKRNRKKSVDKNDELNVIKAAEMLDIKNDFEASSIINQLNEEIHNLRSKLDAQRRTDLKEVKELIYGNKLQSESYWNDFMLLFSKLYPDFFEKLKADHPLLTQNELRIASLIKLNIPQFDIANALNISPESVRKARYRMYKKMKLENDASLVNFIIST